MKISSCIALLVLFSLCRISQANPISLPDSLSKRMQVIDDYRDQYQFLVETARQYGPENSESALATFEKAITLAKENNDVTLTAKGHLEVGEFWRSLANLEKSTSSFFSGLELLESDENQHLSAARLNYLIGKNFQDQQGLEKAMSYFQKSRILLSDKNNPSFKGDLYNSLGEIYLQLEDSENALAFFRKSYEINQLSNDLKGQLINVENIGHIHLDHQRYELAIQFFTHALQINRSINQQDRTAENLYSIGLALKECGKIKGAADSLVLSLSLANNLHLPQLQANILHELYQISLTNERYQEALQHYTLYTNLKDSLIQQKDYTALVELEAKYKMAQNERTIQLSKSELLNHQLIISITVIALVVASLIIGMLTYVYLLKKRNEKSLLVLNQEIDERNKKIQVINGNLEKTVVQRTETIQQQNKRLKEFAFMNSHKVRRPLSNLLGLLALLNEETDMDTRLELISMIEESARDLDAIIFEINHQLREDETLA